VPSGFGTLVVIVLAGLGGPLLGVLGRGLVPVVVGELIAGIIVGPDVLDAVDPTASIVSTLAEIGFAMLMLTVGMHLPLRDRRLGASLRAGALLAAAVGVLAVPAGLLAAVTSGGGHAAVFAVVLASGSAAVLLPALQEARLDGPAAMVVMAQVTIADVVTIVSVPIVLEPHRAGNALLGGLLVAVAALSLLGAGEWIGRHDWIQGVRHLSKERHWALDLRLALFVLFLLAWLAQKSGTSVLIAGFAAGVMVAVVGGPKRLSTQVRGVADGFFVPLYFVVLGARLDIAGLFGNPELLALVAALAALNAAIHLIAAAVLHHPAAGALAATAQLGVPAAVASLGLSEHVLSAGTATAIVAAALVSLATCSWGVALLGRARPSSALPAREAAAPGLRRAG
jgi:Kef-type K+ transport system membrane component KefB